MFKVGDYCYFKQRSIKKIFKVYGITEYSYYYKYLDYISREYCIGKKYFCYWAINIDNNLRIVKLLYG